MASKNQLLELDSDEVLLDRKAKRRLKLREQKLQQQQQQQSEPPPEPPPDDTMSRVALLCQELRWREASLLCQKAIKKAYADGKEELAMGLEMAYQKVERSLRRQMTAAFIVSAKEMLKKEYLLDVGQ
jgi:hypothetical protein